MPGSPPSTARKAKTVEIRSAASTAVDGDEEFRALMASSMPDDADLIVRWWITRLKAGKISFSPK